MFPLSTALYELLFILYFCVTSEGNIAFICRPWLFSSQEYVKHVLILVFIHFHLFLRIYFRTLCDVIRFPSPLELAPY